MNNKTLEFADKDSVDEPDFLIVEVIPSELGMTMESWMNSLINKVQFITKPENETESNNETL